VADFTVHIPRLSVAISEATLVDVLVDDGGHVDEGSPLFLVETEKVETEIPAGASGTIHWTGTTGTTYPIGAEIGVIRRS
jgi:pyruvate/2-oxoglutarate dehydrogenase complex dihydrolipoamide acyltransferase (E2) component